MLSPSVVKTVSELQILFIEHLNELIETESTSFYNAELILLIEEVIELCGNLLQYKISTKHFCDHMYIVNLGLQSNKLAKEMENTKENRAYIDHHVLVTNSLSKKNADSQISDQPPKKPKIQESNVQKNLQQSKLPKPILARCKECDVWYARNKASAHSRSNVHKTALLQKNDNDDDDDDRKSIIFDGNMNQQIAMELIKARKAVRRKYQALKSDVASMQVRQERGLKPIIEPLQELIKTIKSELPTKQEPKSLFSTPQKDKYDYSFLKESPKRRQTNIYQKYLPSTMPSFLQGDDVFEITDSEDVISTPEQTTEDITQNNLELTQTPAYNDYLETFHPLVRSFVDTSIKRDRDLDHTHGLKHDATTEKWKIGDTFDNFEQDNFKVQNITYKGEIMILMN
ncbi:unnamed protein product [Ceutorhynchus assimilis]|uniref:Uncharacterized protein n=1 Tax=Ceutorhynchus assimilis TaxID=467358 RepID=A0A9N9MF15_9CUCU|nr:unnamed protein product [Ceutorhynchus assimilis]